MTASYLQHFNLRQSPLSKGFPACWKTRGQEELTTRFRWLLDSPGIGLLTGEAGVGKTSALHQLCQTLSTHEYQIIYHSETDFGRLDLYRQLLLDFGLEAPHRRAAIWRLIKAHVQDITQQQHRLPIWIIDEAQNLPHEFFRDFAAFLNFAFDSQALMTVWFVGHPSLRPLLKRPAYDALHSRIQLFVHFEPLNQSEEFKTMIHHVFKEAGANSTLLSDSGIELIRLASQGKFRQAGQIIKIALQLAFQSNANHLADETIKEAIGELQK